MSGYKQIAVLLVLLGMLFSGVVVAEEEKPKEIVLGASVPMTGPFAFAGIQLNAGLNDFVDWVNEQGGIEGHRVRYIGEDTGYQTDQSVAVFRRITSRADVNFYFGDSTAFQQTINRELERRDILLTGASFASELNDPERYPLQFMLGPDYSEQVGMLLEYIAEETPGASVMLIHSDTEFGRDPIRAARERAEALGLEIAGTIVTPPGASDISAEALKLRRAGPDYAIFHGYVLSPIPEFIRRARQMRLETKFMGTFYTMDQTMIDEMGEAAEGFMGVMPYRYFYDESGPAPIMDVIREINDEYRTNTYVQGWLTGLLMKTIAGETLRAGKALTGSNMRETLDSLEDIDTGGIFGQPVNFRGNSIPLGRIYRADVEAGRMVPVSDWIELE